ncbi:MAG TPA: SusC/RagA family TonB-linked outer membrane protein [Gemmatimonadales bacterium]|nr:SusC/RagA family TonB-linked outer membrane protein [Gemmatimonadales bacterium]
MRRGQSIIGALLAVLWIAPLAAQAPTGTIRGRVVDSTGHEPLAGVTITLGSHRAVSQTDGRFVMSGVPAGTDTLRARIIGYAPVAQPVTVAAGETAAVDFALTRTAVNLSEVVVVGYGEQRAGDITGAVTQVTTKDFNTGTIVSPQQLIENKVAGLAVVDNNEPGGGLSLRVRGQASVNAGVEPLYVVDGIPLGTGSGGGLAVTSPCGCGTRDALNFLSADDIESISVLKDAAAAAIYGANASNGVVLITTKSGHGGPRVEYSGSVSSSAVTRLPSMLNATQFRTAVTTYAPSLAPLLGTANTNWFDLVDQNALGSRHDLAVSGAGASNSYRLSVGYLNQDGILRGTTAQRISLGANYDQRLYDNRLEVRANVRGSRTNDHFTPGGVLYNAAQMGPTQPVGDPTSVTGYYNWPGNLLTSADNPVEVLNLATDHATTYRSVGNVQTKYDFSSFHPLQGLTGTVNLGYDVTAVNHVSFYPNNIHLETKNGTFGSYFRTTPGQTNTILETYLDYRPPVTLGPGNLDVTGGYSYSQSHAEYQSISAVQLQSNLLGDAGIPQTGTPPIPVDTIAESKLISFFGRADYNVGDRYLASVSIRRDGSSRFGAGHQWGNFPAASVGWRISREPFMSSIPAISDLKLRASWGKTGNQAFGDYLQYSSYLACNAAAQVQFGNQFVCPFRPSAVDPNIRWESTETTDLGLDYGILDQRVTGSIDWYTKHTDDLIFTVPVDPASNLSNFVTTNIGSMRNRGIEFTVSARILDGGRSGLSWTADFNAAHNANVLESINPNAVGSTQILTGGIAGGVGSLIQVLEPGQPINSFFVCQQVYAAGKPVEGSYYDLTGAVVTGCTTNRRAFHDPAPHWMLGFSSSMAYLHFDFSFTLRAWLGNYVYNNVSSNLGDYRELNQGAPYNLNTSVLATGFQTQQLLSDYYVESGSFLRLDVVSLGYTFPWQGQQLRMFAAVQNAFTITGYSGVDPTAGVNGIDNNIYPRSRIFTGGLTVRF